MDISKVKKVESSGPEYAEWDPEKKSMAVIAKGPCGGCVIWYVGVHISIEIEGMGGCCLDDLGLDNAPEGISIWEGVYVVDDPTAEDGVETTPEGKFRAPKDYEWPYIKSGYPPWDKADWRLKDEQT